MWLIVSNVLKLKGTRSAIKPISKVVIQAKSRKNSTCNSVLCLKGRDKLCWTLMTLVLTTGLAVIFLAGSS